MQILLQVVTLDRTHSLRYWEASIPKASSNKGSAWRCREPSLDSSTICERLGNGTPIGSKAETRTDDRRPTTGGKPGGVSKFEFRIANREINEGER